ncbi:MAG: molecular chaperone DnaJ [Chloroflexi bacterium]|nr:molecular chaperone DnaJ [Chloroflexota bacterium]
MERTMPRDYYEVLGVQRTASKDEIKQAFRQLARQHHPDVNNAPDAEDRFKEINEAYQVLSDDNRRAAYDRFGHAGVTNGGMPGGGFSGGFPGIDEIFEELFGGLGGFGFNTGRRSRGPARGRDLRHDLKVDFQQAVFGAEIDIEVNRREKCDMCSGSGAKPGTSPRKCPECNGSGQARRVQQTFFNMVTVTDCPRCRGKGEIIDSPCPKCTGIGAVLGGRTIKLKVPPGVDDGMQIRLSSEGEPSTSGGPNGDLYVVVHVEPHEYFKRRNHDIILEISVNVAQAALGDVISIPTVEGDIELTIPAGTQSGKVIRQRGKGVPKLRPDATTAGRGDQLVVVTVEVPSKLTKEQRELFEKLGQTLGREVIPQKAGRGFLDRIADFLGGS